MEIEKDIFNYLLGCGCCKICAIRYLCNKDVDLGNVDSYLTKNDFLLTNTSSKSSTKKCKANPCVACIGLLQEFCLLKIIQSTELLKAKEYDSATFTCSISIPAAILVREHSIKLHLEEKFPKFYSSDKVEIPLNKAWKIYVKDKLATHIGKNFESSDVCNFFINIVMNYKFDIEELSVLKNLQPNIFEERSVQSKKYKGELFTRKGVLNALSHTVSSMFKMHVTVPPDVPTEFLYPETIKCKHNSIFIAGRYCKSSRNLSQSPWIIDGIKTMDTSVQEIIFEKIANIFSIPESSLKFTASGREDCDVRCLGKGRPFYVEILNPKRTKFTFEEFHQLEAAINTSTLIKVTVLQSVAKSDLVKIKEGEDSKTKDYSALCMTKEKVTQEFIDKLNSFAPADIEQKTPIRVLHRRPLANRTRRIHEMKAKCVPDKPFLIDLYIKAQAGTYVKEFVHGDFGRTTPSIIEIINNEIDIIALDVMSIDLDWPGEVTYNTN